MKLSKALLSSLSREIFEDEDSLSSKWYEITSSSTKSRLLKSCERRYEDGFVRCNSLSFGLLLLRVSDVFAKELDTKLTLGMTIQCQVCKRAENWYSSGWSTQRLHLLLKSLETADAGTSMLWRMELQPTGQAKSTAFHAMPEQGIVSTTIRGEMQATIGQKRPDL